jgi:hypothetical protein
MKLKSYKSTIIKKYGTTVEVQKYLGDQVVQTQQTKALLGRSTRTNTNLKTFEHQKEGIFLPDFDIDSGYFVINRAHNEEYLVISTHQEYDGDRKLSIVTNLMKCNHRLTVKGNTKIADSRGNLKSVFGEKYRNVPCYLEHISSQLLQYQPGLSPDTEHRIYTTALNVELTDQVVVSMGGMELVLKVTALDYMTFPGLLVIEVAKDIRK